MASEGISVMCKNRGEFCLMCVLAGFPDGSSTQLQMADDAETDAELMDEMAEFAEEMRIETSPRDEVGEIDDHEGYFASQGISLVELSFTQQAGTTLIEKGRKSLFLFRHRSLATKPIAIETMAE